MNTWNFREVFHMETITVYYWSSRVKNRKLFYQKVWCNLKIAKERDTELNSEGGPSRALKVLFWWRQTSEEQESKYRKVSAYVLHMSNCVCIKAYLCRCNLVHINNHTVSFIIFMFPPVFWHLFFYCAISIKDMIINYISNPI